MMKQYIIPGIVYIFGTFLLIVGINLVFPDAFDWSWVANSPNPKKIQTTIEPTDKWQICVLNFTTQKTVEPAEGIYYCTSNDQIVVFIAGKGKEKCTIKTKTPGLPPVTVEKTSVDKVVIDPIQIGITKVEINSNEKGFYQKVILKVRPHSTDSLSSGESAQPEHEARPPGRASLRFKIKKDFYFYSY